MKKSFIFYIHSASGLVSGLFILLMSLSGAVLVFHDELDASQQPPVNFVSGKIISVDSSYRIIQKQYPHAQISNCVVPENNNRPFSFFIYDSSYKHGEKIMEVFLHPQTGAVLKTRGGSEDAGNNFMSWVSNVHTSFHLGKTGEWLKCEI